MKKVACFILVVCVSLGVAAFAAEPEDILGKLDGTYVELFPVICAPEYDQVWLDACEKAVGAEQAAAVADMLKAACVGILYGEEATAAYTGKEEEAQFNCFFIGGIAQFTIEGNVITGIGESGEVVFSHAYNYIGQDDAMGAPLSIYESTDADSGEFTYFLFASDTPDETFHIEFRYGDDVEALNQLYEGKYAYWLAAGIPADNTDTYAVKSIELFCEENLDAGDDAA